MKIMIFSMNYAPELTGVGKFAGEMGSWFAARGHDVRAVTTPPYYPEWRVRSGYRKWWYSAEKIDGARVTRCPAWVPRRHSGLHRVLHFVSFAASALPVLSWQSLTWRPDLLCVVKPPALALPAGLFAATLGGARSWIHIQDFDLEVGFELGLMKGARLRRFVLAVENWFLRRFARATTISARMLEKLRSKGVSDARSALFPNWVDTDAIRPVTQPTEFRAALGIPPETVVALYSGNMGAKQGLETLTAAARALRDEQDIMFVLCGDGVARSQLEAAANGLSNIRFLRLQPVEKLNALLNTADVHLLPQRASAADLVMPSKLGGILASGRPIVAAAHPDTGLARAVQGAGVIVPPENAPAMAEAVRALARGPEWRAALGRTARTRALAEWNRDLILEGLLRWLDDER
jgi:colanic acid biosynthesis glycosyl transferase WcaI